MRFHIALHRDLRFAKVATDAQNQQAPDHSMRLLSKQLDAQIHFPQDEQPTAIDRLRAVLLGSPQYWMLGRHLAQTLTENDVVFCTGEAHGIPIATVCGRLQHRPKMAVFFHTAHRFKVRVALQLWRAIDTIDLFVTNCSTQVEFLRSYLNLPDHRILFLPEQTDTNFFSPGAKSANKPRPLIVSIGLEKRDYRILAEVTSDLPVDVKISGFSADVKALRKTFPAKMPANMECKFYSWPDLRQLYRDADIVVVSLMESRDTAGVTTLLEAMACGCSVIATSSSGLMDYLDQTDAVMTVAPHDQVGLRQAITYLLANPEEAKLRGQRAYQLAQERYTCQLFLENLTKRLQNL
jgi:glycosyltransferase involved in cell wall biosynthesis